MRVIKDADQRKNEILDAAEHLFGTKGFDNTSTTDILNETGIARGTLYYHFKSKEELLDSMISRMTKRFVEKARKIAEQKEVPVLKRLTTMMLALNGNYSNFNQEILQQVHKPQNALMHQKMQNCLMSEINPLITILIREGTAQGICQTDYPEEAA